VARERLLVALSGGVDSSVAALLLKEQGHEVVCAYMKNWINEDKVVGHCPWEQDIADARAVCDRLGLEFRVVNLMREYRGLVVDYLLDGYQRGLTPNPDVMCNARVKFGVFAAYARAQGFDGLATGHYARRVEAGPRSGGARRAEGGAPEEKGGGRRTEDGGPDRRVAIPGSPAGARDATVATRHRNPSFSPTSSSGAPHSALRAPRYSLLEGLDPDKDQSYFLALLSQEQLAFARFPIGHLRKRELRALAADAGLPTAAKKDSQGICFIGEVKMADFLRAYVPERPGPVVRAEDGRVLGEHRGLHYFTLGQRKGIGIPSNTDHRAYVVVGKRAADHALLVAFDGPEAPGLWTTGCRVHGLSFVGEPVIAPAALECRVRYRDPRVAVEFTPDGADRGTVGRGLPTPPSSARGMVNESPPTFAAGSGDPALHPAERAAGSATLRFDSPQRALASGQILALYRGEELLGGGVFV
jgi:tRNA-specific 2-thiouridylase